MFKRPAVVVTVLFAFAALAPPVRAAEADTPWQPRLGRREQQVTVRFSSTAAASGATFSLCRLHGGKKWAVSSRWDDLNRKDAKMRDVLAEHDYRGTWYLNEPRENFDGRFARKLLTGGNSIGCHSMTHPYLPMLNRNRIFWELAAVRAQWEAAADTTICSFAFPFLAYRNHIEGEAQQLDMADMLSRAGYYHVPLERFAQWVKTGFVVSPLLPPDGQPIEERAEHYLGDPERRQSRPHMSFSMHVWYDTPEAWERFEQQLDRYGRRADWWYCNQSEYAAYTYQQRHTDLRVAERAGERVTLVLLRPVLRDLNDPVPLTIRVEGIVPQQVVGAESPHARTVMHARREGPGVLIDLHHDSDDRLPTKVGLIRNPDNRAEPSDGDSAGEFPGLQALLSVAGDRLKLSIRNAGPPLRDAHATFRLPPAYVPGLVRRDIATIEGSTEEVLQLRRERAGYKYRAGAPFFVAQLDFARGGQPGRLHLTCRGAAPPRDPSFPQGGFLMLGPIPAGDFSLPDVSRAAMQGNLAGFRAGEDLEWQPESREALTTLDPEVVETSGAWRNKHGEQFYVLRSIVHSDQAGPATLLHDSSVEAAWLNGQDVLEAAALRPGSNELVVVARLSGRSFHMTNAGSMLRLTRPGESSRLTG